MRLTERCKEMFWKWYFSQEFLAASLSEFTDDEIKKHFLALDFSFKWGVYVNFFDSMGIFLEDRRYTDVNMAWVIKYPNFDGVQDRYDGLVQTRNDAREKAIQVANDLYNKLNS